MTAFTWKVLCVDDESEHHDNIKRILSSRMDDAFEFTCETSFDEGLTLIKKNRFDLIFLDVHEDKDPPPDENPEKEDQRGEQLLHELKSSRFIPVIFYTGFPAKVDHLKSHVVKVVDKGAPLEEVRNAVTSILSTKLPHLAQHIEEQSRAYMWNNLEIALKKVTDVDISSDIALLVARNLAKNLSQKSVKEVLGSSANLISPLEIYLFPPENGSCNPGDIFKKKSDNTLWMVLTPACDFEQNKCENVLLAQVQPLINHEAYKAWQQAARNFDETPKHNQTNEIKQTVSKARGRVIDLVKNKAGGRFRFFPGTFFLPDCIVDFQNLLTLPITDSNQYEAVCSLDNPYREETLQFFSNYFGRIGTPDYDPKPICDKIDQAFIHK